MLKIVHNVKQDTYNIYLDKCESAFNQRGNAYKLKKSFMNSMSRLFDEAMESMVEYKHNRGDKFICRELDMFEDFDLPNKSNLVRQHIRESNIASPLELVSVDCLLPEEPSYMFKVTLENNKCGFFSLPESFVIKYLVEVIEEKKGE